MDNITAETFIANKTQYADCVVIDIRTKSEYDEWHMPETINIPMPKLTDIMPTMNKEVKYLLLCRSGFKSNAAATVLKTMGFCAASILGGIDYIRPLLDKSTNRKEVI